MKNITKKLFSILIIITITWLFSSCNYTKNENKNTKKTETKVDLNKTTKNDVSKKEMPKKDRFKKVEKGENPITIESKVWTWKIKSPNISPNWAWTANWGMDTGANPLGL